MTNNVLMIGWILCGGIVLISESLPWWGATLSEPFLLRVLAYPRDKRRVDQVPGLHVLFQTAGHAAGLGAGQGGGGLGYALFEADELGGLGGS